MKNLLHDPRFVVETTRPFSLKDHSCDLPTDLDKKELKKKLEADRKVISDLQELLYANGKHAVLLIFQAMDAAGKDSCIRHVMSGVNPQGVSVWSFKGPSSKERSHDFLWRHAQATPARGHIGIHNRSHYEEVLVTRVHPAYILGQNIPGIEKESDITPAFWDARFAAIRAWEKQLSDSGTLIMKFFLNMSREQQKQRFLERIDEKKKQWKFSVADIEERGHWNAYMAAYEAAIGATATAHAPWYILPADEQWESRALVGQLLRERLEGLALKAPELAKADQERLAEARKRLEAEKD